MSESEKYFRYLVEEIHTTIMATVDEGGLPVTAAIDMMDTDGESLFFRSCMSVCPAGAVERR